VSTKDPIPKMQDRECEAVNQVRRPLRENERFANGERNLLSSGVQKGRVPGRTENVKAGNYLALLALRAKEGGRARNGSASTNGVGELGKNGIGSSGRTRTYNPSVNSRMLYP
jgi:hypothetical protein